MYREAHITSPPNLPKPVEQHILPPAINGGTSPTAAPSVLLASRRTVPRRPVPCGGVAAAWRAGAGLEEPLRGHPQGDEIREGDEIGEVGHELRVISKPYD